MHHGALVAASGYALYLFLLHDGAYGTAPLTLCTFQRVLTTLPYRLYARKAFEENDGRAPWRTLLEAILEFYCKSTEAYYVQQEHRLVFALGVLVTMAIDFLLIGVVGIPVIVTTNNCKKESAQKSIASGIPRAVVVTHSLKCAKDKRCRPVCTVVQQEEIAYSLAATSAPWCTAFSTAGSAELNAVFCWYCLLFGKDRNTSWSRTGYTRLGNLVKSIAEHGLSVNHLRSSVAIAAFGENRIETALDHQLKNEISLHNQKVKRNRDILKRVINAVCFLGKQELAFRGNDETENSVNRGNYVELLKYTAEYDPLLAEHLETSTVFKGISNRIQNELIQAVGSTVLSSIKQEIIEVPFVAVMVDETSDVANKAQFSIVLRYVHEGEIKERFLGFCDISNDKHSQAIAELIRHFLSEFGCNEKLIAQTYDGAATMAGNLNVVQALIKVTHPEALFFTVMPMSLTSFCLKAPAKYLKHPQEIESDILAPINGFFTLLEDFKFVFLLNTFDKIFPFTDVLYNILQNQANDILYCQEKIQETRRSIATLRDDYEGIFQETVSQVAVKSLEIKTMSELAKLLSTNSMLKKSFQQFNVLVTLLCTIPVSTSSVEKSFSTLKRIKSYSRNSTGEERLSHLGIISIEARLLGELRKKKEFLDEVVTKFASQERRIEFQFR
ncbi:hypothetical protein ANN_21392 [Periplaneta americana]|uniref:Zinc finger MYM-type protein 1-like n=1 Tax=Periplaneta americana TaxID=6978 RepID=A0ABQ8SFX1_PERAM|nr:hypothetical protein ANN_21392 [Periplaneta americana]